MKRKTPEPVAPTGQLDKEAPIKSNFDDGREVSAWWRAIRDVGLPGVDLIDQLQAAGWEHITITKIMEVVDECKRLPIGYSAIFNCLSKPGCELEVEVTDTHGNTYQVALCRNENTLLHGHTANQRGPERRVRLKLSTDPTLFGGMLLATR